MHGLEISAETLLKPQGHYFIIGLSTAAVDLQWAGAIDESASQIKSEKSSE